MARIVKVGLIQNACSDDVEQNVRKTLEGIAHCAARGAQIVCTQELFRSKYFCQTEDIANFDFAEPIPGETSDRLCAAAREHGVVLIGSLYERRAPGLYHNTAVIIDADGALLGKYRKMHIPHDPLYFEKYYFTPGDLGFRAWDTRAGRIGTLVCWDQWFPEGARLTAMDGAQILFYPTAIGWHDYERESFGPTQHAAWETMQRSHAIANGVFVVAVNRVGQERTVKFFGQSFVSDPIGRVLFRASSDREETAVIDLDMDVIEDVRRNWPFLRDRRTDAYGDLTRRYRD